MSRCLALWLAWAVCALSLTLTALNFLLIALNVGLDVPAFALWPELTSIAVVSPLTGAIIASRLPNQPIGWICCAIGLIAAVDHFAGEYAVYALLALRHPLPGGEAMLWLQGWFWMLFIGLIVFLLLLFPTGRLPSIRWRPFAWVSGALISGGVVWSSVISPDVGFSGPPSPIQLSVLLLGGVAAASLVVGRREGGGATADQVAALCWPDILCRQWPPYRLLLLLAPRRVVGIVGYLFARGDWWLERPHRHRCSHPALQTLRDRPHRKPHPRLRLTDGLAGRTLLWWHRRIAEGLRRPHRPAVHTRCGRLHPPDRGVVYAVEATHPVLHRQALLPQQVRRQKDPGGLLREAARPDGPGCAES